MSLIDEITENLGMSRLDILRVIATAPARYFVFEIAKRNGGLRTIAQPARELKEIQRYIVQTKLSLFPVHQCATAYMEGASIGRNAEVHLDAGPLLKMDFEGFFPSIKVDDWMRFARRNRRPEIELADLTLYARLLFWSAEKGSPLPRCLSIGAPSSPAMSNILLHPLDMELSAYAKRIGVKYTRYADDITVSATDAAPIRAFETFARKAVARQKSPLLRFNEEKRRFHTKAGRRTVTGLVITPDRKISIGRERKREISAMMHHLSLGRLNDENRALLKGLLGFCLSVEVTFVETLRGKYGDKFVESALRYHIPKKGS